MHKHRAQNNTERNTAKHFTLVVCSSEHNEIPRVTITLYMTASFSHEHEYRSHFKHTTSFTNAEIKKYVQLCLLRYGFTKKHIIYNFKACTYIKMYG